MVNWEAITRYLPEVIKPTAKKLGFNTKLKWTGVILVAYYLFSHIPLFGLGQNALQQFEQLSIILGASFGSIISLGIGPIVTASIILQLLNGAQLLGIDVTTPEGSKKFQAMQKVAIMFFIIFESFIYVFMGGLAPDPGLVGTSVYLPLQLLLVGQLFIGGYAIVLMDQVTQKWGFGSGVSLFIAAGVSNQIFVRALNPLPSPTNPDIPTGVIPFLIKALQTGDSIGAVVSLATLASTLLVFFIVVYGQAMKVEIPLSFGRIRGYGIRWPLRFIYASNIPVILIAALMANLQLWGQLLQKAGYPLLGTFSGARPVSGLVMWIQSPDIVTPIFAGTFTSAILTQAFIYGTIMILGSVVFSVLWVKTANMDAAAQAKQIMSSGLQIPGFRRDPRVLESILNRYIPGLTVMGGAFVGFLAALADLGNALSRGTGILLAVMIVYRLYEDIAKQHAFDMHPALRKVIESD
jgi:preprotein translocase subunit SecY